MSSRERQMRGQRAAGRHLRLLLLRPGPYRDKWEVFAQNVRPDDIRQDAICDVLSLHLYEVGERSEDDTSLSRSLKDRVSRALGGKGLSVETLRWFLKAFHISPHDSQRLLELYRGDIHPMTIVGEMAPPVGMAMPRHETTLLFEHHYIGADRIPAQHHTQQTLRSLVDGMDSYQYRFDTADVEIRVNRGGRPSQICQLGEEMWAVDITFNHPLKYGEEAYLDYWAICRYDDPPPPEFRRAAHLRVQHLDMRVEFDPAALPRSVWWAEWQDYRAPHEVIVDEEEVLLDEEKSVHRYLDSIEHTVVGFRWEW
jgi:hypothetical protein